MRRLRRARARIEREAVSDQAETNGLARWAQMRLDGWMHLGRHFSCLGQPNR
jgi:hypothetical protein